MSELKTHTALNVIGDGRCDSPGFSAKYEIYSFMNQQSNKIIDFTLTNVGSVANSFVMEKIGFAELLEKMEKTYGFKIRSVTTNSHLQIRALLEKVRPDVIHQFDDWHISKSIKKKLSRKLAKCEKLAKWSKSIINRFWWCCRTCEGDQKLLKEKWVSVLFHIRNRHTWETDKNFILLNRCAHAPLSIHQEECWVVGRKLSRFSSIRSLLKDPGKLTEFYHTGQIEVFHSLNTHRNISTFSQQVNMLDTN